MIRHFIWDFDGTLFDTYPVMAETLREAFAEEGYHEPVGEIIRLMRITMTHAYKVYGDRYGLPDVFFKRYNERRFKAEKKLCRPYAGADALCRLVCARGCANYLYTHRGLTAVELMELYGHNKLFTESVTSENGFSPKPSPDAVLYLMDKYGMVPDETVMIGDRDIDILSGKNAPGRVNVPTPARVSR